jgi:hypothetical protein
MIYFFLLLLLTACAPHYLSNAAFDLREGHFEKAQQQLAKADLPFQKCNDAPLLLLSRAMVYFQAGQITKSLSDFSKAHDAIDYYSQVLAHEIAGQTLLQDDIGPYVPPSFEIELARVYEALAFLHQGDESNAAATLLYLENHNYKNPLATYLLATLFDRRGDHSNARILQSRLGVAQNQGNVLVVYHLGKAPIKKSEIAPTSIVSGALLESLLAAYEVEPALSTLAGVPVPVLEDFKTVHSFSTPLIHYNITKAAHEHLEKELPLIATRAAARLLIRRAAVASVKKEAHQLMDIGMLIANTVTQADTRSWNMLPATIELHHISLPPGKQTIDNITFNVKEQGLTVVEIFKPHKE